MECTTEKQKFLIDGKNSFQSKNVNKHASIIASTVYCQMSFIYIWHMTEDGGTTATLPNQKVEKSIYYDLKFLKSIKYKNYFLK